MAVVQPASQQVTFPALTVGTNVSEDIDTGGCQFLNVYTNVSVTNSGTVTVTVQGKDPASGAYYTILADTAISTVTAHRIKVGPTIASSANVIAQDYLPRTIRIQAVTATAVPTFTVGVDLTD